MWSAIELLGPPDLRSVLTASGATSIRGLSTVAALGESGIDEELFVMSPGGKDLLTRCVTNRPLEAVLARYLPRDASSASITTFDLTALVDGMTKLLPDAMKRDFENTLIDIKKGGFDLRADLIDNIGPTFATTGDFGLADVLQGDGAGARDGRADELLREDDDLAAAVKIEGDVEVVKEIVAEPAQGIRDFFP